MHWIKITMIYNYNFSLRFSVCMFYTCAQLRAYDSWWSQQTVVTEPGHILMNTSYNLVSVYILSLNTSYWSLYNINHPKWSYPILFLILFTVKHMIQLKLQMTHRYLHVDWRYVPRPDNIQHHTIALQ